ncbi:MAG: SH3 domain-containing protein [Promethearchaeota archaeon]
MMNEKSYQVIEDYNSNYTDPLVITKNEKLTIGEKLSEWSGWIWCTNRFGKSRWVPKSYIEINGKTCKVKQDYEATELSVKIGDILIAEKEEADWILATNERGKRGWVPLRNVKICEK